MDTCYIVCAADMSAGRFSPREGDLVIAADAGCRHLQRLGVSPHLIVGDFDSLGHVPSFPNVEVCPVEKDDTDSMIAIKKALELGFGQIFLFGALGGRRLDHTLANIQALAEALTLAKRAGVDPELVFQAIRGGLAGSTVMEAKAPMMLSGNDKPGFKIDLHIKDLNNALDCAHSVGAPVPMTAAAQEVLQWLHAGGHGQEDHSAMVKYYSHLTGAELSE